MIALSGTTQSIVCHIAVLYGGPRSKLRRNRKAAHHATPAATTSCANARPMRVLILRSMLGAQVCCPATIDRPAVSTEYEERGEHHEYTHIGAPARRGESGK